MVGYVRAENRTFAGVLFNSVVYLLLVVFTAAVVYPFLYMLALSFNEGTDALVGGITIWPRKLTLENYRIIFEHPSLANSVLMSVARTVVGTVAAVVCTGLVGYCFTKRSLPGYRFYVTLFIVPMFVGAGLIPTFLAYRAYGLYDSFLVYFVPHLVWGTNAIIMRTFFDDIPSSLSESAVIDGAGELTIFFRLILPLSKPVVATIALFNAVWQWNTWTDTFFYTRKSSLDTLSSMLSRMILQLQAVDTDLLKVQKRASYVTPQVIRAAMTMVTTLPIIVVYPFLQKYFVKGVMIGAVKA
jgi:putative aldouronate transport system permease protein